MKLKKYEIVDPKSGEVLELANLSDQQLSDLYVKFNTMKKRLAELVEKIDKFIKENKLEFEEGKAEFMDLRYGKYNRYRFNKDKFEKEATKEEKDLYEKWKEVENNYLIQSEVIRIQK